MNREIVVDLSQVYVTLQNKVILKDINLSLAKGSFIGIIGPNGAGKTTLLRLILGLLQPTRGQVKVFGENPAQLNRKKYRVGYLPQRTQFDRRFPVNVSDVVLMGSTRETGFFRLPNSGQKKRADAIMARVGILDLKNRPIGELSGGQQQLAFLASALATRPGLLILDEPTNGLDPAAQDNFYKLVREVQGTEMTVLVVSHDLAAIATNAHSLICINKTISLQGSSQEVMEQLFGKNTYQSGFNMLFNTNCRRKQA